MSWGSVNLVHNLSVKEADYKNVPTEQVDWAALAKQWINQKEAGSIPSAENNTTQSKNTQPAKPHVLPPAPKPALLDTPRVPVNNQQLHPTWPNWNTGTMNMGMAWRQPMPWPPAQQIRPNPTSFQPPIQQPFPPRPMQQKIEFEYGHGQQLFEYNHHNLSQDNGHHTPKHQEPDWGKWNMANQDEDDDDQTNNSEMDFSDFQLDMVRRRSLPSWIREGLEKMEHDKMRKEQLDRQKQERERLRDERKEQLLGSMGKLGQQGEAPLMKADQSETIYSVFAKKEEKPSIEAMAKAKQDGIDDSDDDSSSTTSEKSASSSTPMPMTAEERQEFIMRKTRKWMLEILLDVTETEMRVIAKEVVARFKLKSSKKGAGYGSDSAEDDDDEADDSDREKDIDSDAELRETIAERLKAWDHKSQQIMADLEEVQRKEEDASHHNRSNVPSHEEQQKTDEQRVTRSPTNSHNSQSRDGSPSSHASTEGIDNDKSGEKSATDDTETNPSEHGTIDQKLSELRKASDHKRSREHRSRSRDHHRSRGRRSKSRDRHRRRRSRSRSHRRKSRSRSRHRRSRSRSHRRHRSRSRRRGHRRSRSRKRSRRSKSRDRKSRSRDRKSRSRERKSRSHERKSRSRERKSRSRDRKSKSRERKSRSRDRKLRSHDRKSRSRERRSKSRDRKRSSSRDRRDRKKKKTKRSAESEEDESSSSTERRSKSKSPVEKKKGKKKRKRTPTPSSSAASETGSS